MSMVQVFKDRLLTRIKWNVEDFLNEKKGIHILDITWMYVDSYWHCIITYFTVD